MFAVCARYCALRVFRLCHTQLVLLLLNSLVQIVLSDRKGRVMEPPHRLGGAFVFKELIRWLGKHSVVCYTTVKAWDRVCSYTGVLVCLAESLLDSCGSTVVVLVITGLLVTDESSLTSLAHCSAMLELVVATNGAFFQNVCYGVVPRYVGARMHHEGVRINVIIL